MPILPNPIIDASFACRSELCRCSLKSLLELGPHTVGSTILYCSASASVPRALHMGSLPRLWVLYEFRAFHYSRQFVLLGADGTEASLLPVTFSLSANLTRQADRSTYPDALGFPQVRHLNTPSFRSAQSVVLRGYPILFLSF